MKATIICIGDEVLCGDVLNSNGTFFAKELTEIGIEVVKHVVVSDDEDMVEGAFHDAVNISDIIITTGGLGPTLDDMTKEAIAKVTNRPLEENEEARKHVENYFIRKGKDYVLTPNNYRQALFPKGAKILDNDRGTAPGALLEIKDKIIIMLPGPPRENTNMYYKHIKDYLINKLNKFFAVKDYMTSGIGESEIEYKLRDLLPDIEGVSVNTYFNDSGVKVKAVSKADNLKHAVENLDKVDEIITKNFKEYIYSVKGETLPQKLIATLKNRGLTFSCAESCTGGLLASYITEIPGASEVFMGSAVTYTNEVKHSLLGVKEETLKQYGAVSSNCVEEMVLGCAERFDTDVAISISGIAGPGGGSEEKPVGTVYMGFYYNGKVTSKLYNITGERKRVQTRSAYYAINNILKIINENVD